MKRVWMRRIAYGIMLFGLVGCQAARNMMQAANGRRVQLQFFNPAERLSAPLRASTVTLQNAVGDSRSLDVDVEIATPSDSSILLIMKDGVALRELLPLLGVNGIEEVRRSQRSAAPDLALPVVQVSAEGVWKPLDRQIDAIALGKYAVRPGDRYCVLPPGTKMLLRFQQLVYSVPETRNGRFRLRVNWISFKPASRPPFTCGAALGTTVANNFSAVANDSEAFARRLAMSWIGVVIITVVLLGGGFAIVKS
jgi:hypothetical protein